MAISGSGLLESFLRPALCPAPDVALDVEWSCTCGSEDIVVDFEAEFGGETEEEAGVLVICSRGVVCSSEAGDR